MAKKSSKGPQKSAKKGASKKAAPRKTAKRVVLKRATKAPAKKKRAPDKSAALDLSALPSELVTREGRHVCLACVLDVMTRHMGLAVRKAQLEIKRYAPTLEEVQTRDLSRPFFAREGENDSCPYCGSAPKWHAQLITYRIENNKSIDAQRRGILNSLTEASFVVLQEKATQQDAFFQWVEKISASIDPDDPRWLLEISRDYLSRKELKTDWNAAFSQLHSIRRSRRLENGWELDQGRLFLAPMLFDELLLVQYLVSRAHRAGGLTLEGRYTLPELFARLRKSGYLRAAHVEAHNPPDAFEQLLTQLGGGESALRFYYIVDRRNLLERIKALENLRVPRAKA
jgi:hypothetical protein